MGLLTMAILIIGDLFLPPPGIPLFSILYFGWKYIKIKVKADIYLTYLLFLGIPQIILFFIIRLIALPFKESYGVLKWIEDKLENLTKGVEYVEHNIKKSVFGAVIFLVFAFSIFQPSLGTLTSAASVLSFSSIQGALITVVLLLVGAFLPVIILATIVSVLKGGIGGSDDSGSKLDSMYTNPGASSAADEYRDAMESREQFHEAKSAVEKGASKAAEAEGSGVVEWFKGCVPSNVSSIGGKLAELNPMASEAAEAGAKKAGRAGVASEGAEMGYEAVEAGEGIALWPLMIFAIILFVFQIGIIFALFGFMLKVYMPLIGGPIMGALGFSADYANYGGQAIAPYIPSINLEPVALAVQSQAAKLQCFREGPECFSEWQMNNTQRPGSEEEGEKYDLEVEGFEIERGQTIDVAYQRPARPLSVSFAMQNPMNGLKGIPAKDVQYKVVVRNNRDEQVCGTDFIPIQFYEQSDSIGETTIPPGDSYVVGVRTDTEETLTDNLNLFDCALLQPGQARVTRNAELSYMYDYFSQSNLRIRAMSYENYADRDLERSYKKSETADTPVKSFINVYSPVIYDELEDGERNARPFEVQIGFETDDPDVKYRVQPDSVTFTPSRSTEIIDGSCGDFELQSTGRADVQTYELDDSGRKQINSETFDANRWYTTARSPSVLECTMKLANPDEVSSSGETLIMDVAANYTVIKDDITDDFQIWNTLCSGKDCPLLLPHQQLQGQSDEVKDNFLTTCNPGIRVTAVGGCDVRSLGLDYDENIEDEDSLNQDYWQNGKLGGGPDGFETLNYELINEGETAYDWNYFIEEEVSESDYQYAYWAETGGKPVIGMDEEDWNGVVRDRDAPGRALYITDYGELDTEFEDNMANRVVCKEGFSSTKNAVERYAEIWADNRGAEKLLYLKPWTVKNSCAPNQGWLNEVIDNFISGEDKQDKYEETKNECNGVLTVTEGGAYMCYN